MTKELVITGMGAVTPVGIGMEAYWSGLLSGESAIREIEGLDHSVIPIHHAAQVRGLNPKDYLPTRLAMDLEPYMQYAYIAALEALEDSGLPDGGERTGLVMGTALHGVDIIARTQETFDKKASEAAEATKKLRASATEQSDTAERIAKLEQALKVKDWTAKYMEQGYDKATAEQTAQALSEGDMETVFANAEKYKTSLEERIKADLMKNAALTGTVGSKPKNEAMEQAKRIGQQKANANKDTSEVLKHYM